MVGHNKVCKKNKIYVIQSMEDRLTVQESCMIDAHWLRILTKNFSTREYHISLKRNGRTDRHVGFGSSFASMKVL